VRAPRRSRLSIGTAALALVAAAATVLTRPLVQWDQLALWAVTVGTDVHGYWYAAHDDSVRFLLIGSSEVTQGQYAPMVLLHVLAPVVGAIGAAATAVLVLRRPQESG
jgi:quinol-cytochrome oxidoreductase complex cytochrome b subunit